jgi:GTP pyrophosphokinase
METVKVDLFANEVYVFTPGGEVRAFPRGATPVDFAYAIHTDLGHECTGARVNGSQVSLRYEMQNGDVIEIQRTRGGKPKPHWTQFVKTGRAATKIRGFLRQEENARAAQIGQEVFERELRRYGLSLTKAKKGGQFESGLRTHRLKNERELFVALGYGKTRMETILEAFLPSELIEKGPPETTETTLQKIVKKVLPKTKGGIIVDGLEGLALHFPKCCSPVKGDTILGFISAGKGVVIHRSDCRRILDYDPARRVEARWDGGSKQERPVELRVMSQDLPGLLANITQSFHVAGVNITAVNCRTSSDRRAVNNFTVLISDVEQLRRVIKTIEKIDGVTGVERVSD